MTDTASGADAPREQLAALKQIAALSTDPDNWQPYDSWGDMVDTDPSNNGDVRDFGLRLGYWYAAKIARAALLAQPLAPRSEPSLVERAIEIAQEKVGFRSDVSMHDYGGHSVPDGVHRADCRWCAIVRDARGAVDS
jgi:hypothetical protein